MAMDRFGNQSRPSESTGNVHKKVLEALQELEQDQEEFLIWNEVRLTNGDYVRAHPQYRSAEGPWFDWACVSFNMDDGSADLYPSRVLAFYDDTNGNTKAIIHSVDYKLTGGGESKFGDSRLIQHYRQEFQANGQPSLRSVRVESLKHAVQVYPSKKYKQPIPPIVRSPMEQRKHTVKVVLPRSNWAELFMIWSKEMKDREQNETVNKYRLND